MLESIHIGMSGLIGYSKGLRVIANNTANLNTPGFKGASLQFSDMFYSSDNSAGTSMLGHGLDTGATRLSFRQGELRGSGNPLDLAIDGLGFFIVREPDGTLAYTRAGQFSFDVSNMLSERNSGAAVMGLGKDGELLPVSLDGLASTAATPTSTVRLAGNLSSTASTQAVEGLTAIDSLGTRHTLRAVFSSASSSGSGPGTQTGRWLLQLYEGSTLVGTQPVVFSDGKPTAASERLTFQYTPAGLAGMPLVLELGSNVSSYAAGTLSSLAFSSQDGMPAGSLTATDFDADGVLKLRYSNGQSKDGIRLALARFMSEDDVLAVGGNRFVAADGASWIRGAAGDGAFGVIRAGSVEISNVDLSQEFSDLVIMQRGYQASSQIISTANELLQELFSMKGAT